MVPKFPEHLSPAICEKYMKTCREAITIFQGTGVEICAMLQAALLTALACTWVQKASSGIRHNTNGYTVRLCGVVPLGTSGTVTAKSDSGDPIECLTVHPIYANDNNRLSVTYDQYPRKFANGEPFDTANMLPETCLGHMPVGFIFHARVLGNSYSDVSVLFSPAEGTLFRGLLSMPAASASASASATKS